MRKNIFIKGEEMRILILFLVLLVGCSSAVQEKTYTVKERFNPNKETKDVYVREQICTSGENGLGKKIIICDSFTVEEID